MLDAGPHSTRNTHFRGLNLCQPQGVPRRRTLGDKRERSSRTPFIQLVGRSFRTRDNNESVRSETLASSPSPKASCLLHCVAISLTSM